jgi:hypothetical protein
MAGCLVCGESDSSVDAQQPGRQAALLRVPGGGGPRAGVHLQAHRRPGRRARLRSAGHKRTRSPNAVHFGEGRYQHAEGPKPGGLGDGRGNRDSSGRIREEAKSVATLSWQARAFRSALAEQPGQSGRVSGRANLRDPRLARSKGGLFPDRDLVPGTVSHALAQNLSRADAGILPACNSFNRRQDFSAAPPLCRALSSEREARLGRGRPWAYPTC